MIWKNCSDKNFQLKPWKKNRFDKVTNILLTLMTLKDISNEVNVSNGNDFQEWDIHTLFRFFFFRNEVRLDFLTLVTEIGLFLVLSVFIWMGILVK